ncbi:hypothetical protein [Superficieibacter sp. HKU1]|nr:hypothetical protein [Superficieibacter sp. HKU1]WES67602.1 hypothetical protein P0H77_18610 [Superficieibacter sp. HKU1]
MQTSAIAGPQKYLRQGSSFTAPVCWLTFHLAGNYPGKSCTC